jgi:hypothetical protein
MLVGMTFVVKASGPADILAMVPALVGFTPRNSIVLLPFQGKRTHGAMRADLPNPGVKDAHKHVATFLIGMLCKLPQVDAVVIAIFTDDRFDGTASVPRSTFADLVGRRIEQSGFELRESICQAADGWSSYLDPQVPVGGRPLHEVTDSAVAATIPAGLRAAAGDLDLPRRIPDAPPAEMTRMRKQLAEVRRVIGGASMPGADEVHPDSSTNPPLGEIGSLAEGALRWGTADVDANGAVLLFALQSPTIRDLVMLHWAMSPTIGDRLFGSGPMADALVGELLVGIGPRPDVARIERGIDLLLTLTARARDKERRPLLCMLAWLNWALGRGTQAGRNLGEVLTFDPGYHLAGHLASLFQNRVFPEWAFDEADSTSLD